MARGRRKGGIPAIAQKRTRKAVSSSALPEIPLDAEMVSEDTLRANTGIFRPMNDENGRCDVKILRRGLNVQVR